MRVLEPTVRRESTPSIQSLDRGLVILEAVAGSPEPLSLAQLTGLMGIDRSSVFRLANTLKRRGFLACPSRKKEYVLGPSIWRISRQYDWSNMLVEIAHEQLKILTSQTGETAHLAIREGSQALFVDSVATNHIIAVAGQVGELVPLYCTAHGKALLADFDRGQLEALFGAGPLPSHTRRPAVPVESLAQECSRIKAAGFTTDDEEFREGLRCAAAPIRDRDGLIIGSIGISAPAARFSMERCLGAGRLVSQAALEIGKILNSLADQES